VIAAAQVSTKNREGVDGVDGVGGSAGNDDDVPLVKAVSLVRRQVIRKEVSGAREGGAQNALAGRAEAGIVVVDEFT
jgi:hypothetical protein